MLNNILFKGRNPPKQKYKDKKHFEFKEKLIDRKEHDGLQI